MKKKYFAPEMEIVKVEAQQILAGSIPKDGDYNGEGVGAPEFEFGEEDTWYDWKF